MQRTVALRGRTRLAALLHQLEQASGAKSKGGARMDRRNQRTWRQLVLGVVVARSTRLLAVGRVVAAQRRVQSVKAAAMALGYFLAQARVPQEQGGAALLAAAVQQVDPQRLVTYRGKVLVVIDPTEYPKRSRGRGKQGRQMQHIGRVRKASGTGTTYGYVDIWAGLVLKTQQFLPLARRLCSNRHPAFRSQNAVEEAVLADALSLLTPLDMPAIVIGDRGLGRKELIIDLATRQQDVVLRVDDDITVFTTDCPGGQDLATALAAQPWCGVVDWKRGEHGALPCRLRTLRAIIRFSRTGRKGDVKEATVTFVQAVPCEGTHDPLLVATTLPAETAAQTRAVVRLYACRWAIEVGFETMHAWGQDAFMVRSWVAIDRLLWVVAVAYALVVLALFQRPLRGLRTQATLLLKRLSVVGTHLTTGKMAEAIGLDFHRHHRAWTNAWLA